MIKKIQRMFALSEQGAPNDLIGKMESINIW